MASVTSHLLEEPLALDPVCGDLLAVLVAQRPDIDMALDAARLLLRPPEQRMLPVLDVAMRHRDRIDRGPLPFVTGSAAELVGRMVADDRFVVRMGAKRLRRILEAVLVDSHMARLAAVHACDRLVEGVAIEVVDRGLLDL